MGKFEQLLADFSSEKKIKIGVVAPDEISIQAVFDSRISDYLTPVLIGDKEKIQAILNQLDKKADIVSAVDDGAASRQAVALVKSGDLDFLMKGHLQTSTFLKAIVNKETGIVTEGLLTHVAVNDVPAYHKLLVTTDGGMVLAPTKAQKMVLIQHGVAVLKKLGVKKPKVALLAAAENVNQKIPSSVEAFEITEEIQQGQADFEIAGPISLDLAISPAIVAIKHYENPVAGDADLLVGPDITTMNVLGKSLTVLSGAQMAGLVMGARVPIVMVSRGSSAEEKMYAILLAMYCSR